MCLSEFGGSGVYTSQVHSLRLHSEPQGRTDQEKCGTYRKKVYCLDGGLPLTQTTQTVVAGSRKETSGVTRHDHRKGAETRTRTEPVRPDTTVGDPVATSVVEASPCGTHCPVVETRQ